MSKKLLIKNSVTGALQMVLVTILTFLCIKIFISKLGEELFGIFSVITVIGNVNIFANLGLNYSLIKFLSEQGKSRESDYDIIVAILLLLCLLFPLTALLIIFNKFIIISVLNIPDADYSKSIYLYIFLTVSNLLILVGLTLNAVLDSQQKIYVNNFLQMIYSMLYWGLVLLVVWVGYSLYEVGLAILLSAVVWFLLVLYYFLKYWGIPETEGLNNNFMRIVRKQLGYSLKIYSSGAINFFYEPLTKVLISNFVGVAYVGYFDIALKIRTVLWNFIGKILYPLYPYIAKMNDVKKISFLVNDVQKKLLYAVLPIIVIILFVSEPFVSIWINGNTNMISISVITIASSFMINIVGMPNYQYLITKKVGVTVVFQAMNVIINIVVFFSLYKYLSYYAILVSFNISTLFAFLMTIYFQKKYLNSFIFDSYKYILNLVILFTITFIVALTSDILISSALFKIIIIPLVVILTSFLVIRYLNYFNDNDTNNFFKESETLSYYFTKLFIRQ